MSVAGENLVSVRSESDKEGRQLTFLSERPGSKPSTNRGGLEEVAREDSAVVTVELLRLSNHKESVESLVQKESEGAHRDVVIRVVFPSLKVKVLLLLVLALELQVVAQVLQKVT